MKIIILFLSFIIILNYESQNVIKNKTLLRKLEKYDDLPITSLPLLQPLKFSTNNSSHIQTTETNLGICIASINNNLFDLYQINLDKCRSYVISSNESEIHFNFCNDIPTHCEEKKGLVVDKKNCTIYASDSSTEKKWKYKNINNDQHLLVEFPPGEPCKNTNRTILLDILCDKKAFRPIIINNEEFSSEKCENIIKIKSKIACLNPRIETWYDRFDIHFSASILFLFGITYLLFGLKYQEITIPALIAFMTALIIHNVGPTIPLIACVCFGLAFMLMTLLIDKLIYYLIIFFLSNLISILVFHGFVKLNFESNKLYWILVCFLVVINIIILKYIENFLKIALTAIIGAYTTVRAISLLFGNYPNEFFISQLFKYNEHNQINRIVITYNMIIYLGLISILILISIVYQFYLNEKINKNESKYDNSLNKNNLKL